jgi:septal ring factor EnvC (AmiA/AmiB activator)
VEKLLHGKKIKKTLLTFISILYSIAVSLQPVIAVGSIDQKESLKSSLQKETEALKANLQKAKEGMKEEAEKKNTLDKQIEIVKSQVDNSNRYITSLEQEIKRHEQGISSILEDIKKKMKALKSSLKSIYMAGDASTIDIILSAKDFDDFLDKAELVKSVSDTISSLIKQLNSSLKELENEKSALQETVDTAQKERDIQSKRRSELQKLFDESEKMLSELQKSEQQVKKELDENDAELKQIEKQIREYYEEQRRKKAAEEARRKARQSFGAKLDKQTAAVSEIVHKGSYTWPVPGYFHISSDFYDTVNRGGKTHGAIDIAGSGIYGAKVVAAGKGQVIIASSGGWGGGYGTYMVIDHGDSRLTLYGHLSGLAVEAGDTVLQGQLIGYVGSTGISTGPHLHFECRVNGVKVNPMPWFNR